MWPSQDRQGITCATVMEVASGVDCIQTCPSLLKKEGVNWITFGSQESYILETASGRLKWWGIREALSKAITEWPNDLVSVSLGRDKSYCAIFQQSTLFYNVSDDLSQILNKMKTPDGKKVNNFDKVWLSAYDDRYYVAFNGDSSAWWQEVWHPEPDILYQQGHR